MQFLPVAPGQTLVREIAYGWPDDRRAMRVARYLNWRINRRVSTEDRVLIERVQAGMGSMSYTSGPLGETEVCLRAFAHRVRSLIPESRLPRAPSRGWSQKLL
jgi:phenylpropionate dioxygenase-like ring-hydroxylating dioxygenase large terminal subunit